MVLKLLVVEDHALVREGLLQTLRQLEAGVQRDGAQNAAEALRLLELHSDYDLILLDLMLPDVSGMTLLGVLRKRFPAIPVVILSALDDPDNVARAMRQGASGFVPKSSSSATLLEALRRVLAGDSYLPDNPGGVRDPPGRRRSVAEIYGLTASQARVLDLLAEGKSNREIADFLNLVPGTIKIHVSAIFKLLNVSNRAQAMAVVSKHRLPRL